MTENTAQEASNRNDCDELRDLLPAYLIGAADADEAARAVVLLERCPEVKAEIGDIWTATQVLYARVEPVEPPQRVHDKLLARVRADKAQADAITQSTATPLHQQKAEAKPVEAKPAEVKPTEAQPVHIRPTGETTQVLAIPQRTGHLERQPLQLDSRLVKPIVQRRDTMRWAGWAALAAALIVLVATNILWANRLDDAEAEIDFLNQQRQEAVTLAGRADLHRVSLNGTEETDVEFATLLWDTDGSTITLTTATLPTLPANQTYQLWLINGDQPVSAGIFKADEWGVVTYTTTLDEAISTYEAVAISREPASGSQAPTTTPLAVGEFAQSKQDL